MVTAPAMTMMTRGCLVRFRMSSWMVWTQLWTGWPSRPGGGGTRPLHAPKLKQLPLQPESRPGVQGFEVQSALAAARLPLRQARGIASGQHPLLPLLLLRRHRQVAALPMMTTAATMTAASLGCERPLQRRATFQVRMRRLMTMKTTMMTMMLIWGIWLKAALAAPGRPLRCRCHCDLAPLQPPLLQLGHQGHRCSRHHHLHHQGL